MKKILLASSALALTASVAAAEVTVGGDAYYGIVYVDQDNIFLNNTTGRSQNYAFAFDLDIDFTASGETDSGLIFGASIDADDTPKAQGVRGFDGEVFVSGAFGRLAMGDTDGAAEAIVGDLDFVSLTGLGDFNEVLYLLSAGDPDCSRVQETDANGDPVFDALGNPVFEQTMETIVDPLTGATVMVPSGDFVTDGPCEQGPLALYTYDFEGFTGAIGLNDDEGFSLGAGYDGGAWSVGIAYEQVPRGTEITVFDAGDFVSGPNGELIVAADNRVQHIIGQASYTFANTTIKGYYGQLDTDQTAQFELVNGIPVQTTGDGTFDQYGISIESTFDAVTVGAFYRELSNDTPGLKRSFFYGVGASYDLGGGLAVVGSIGGGEVNTVAETPFIAAATTNTGEDYFAADFGLDFAF